MNDGANSVSGSGASGSAGGSGNSNLASAFDEAISSARETLQISTKGNATLNALRARPQ
ncbi:MAG: hypothetical protein AAF638_08020 [Pseudomonadota bacterium]